MLGLDHDFFPPTARPTRVLDFDIENRPLSYWAPDMPTAQVTAIASAWVGDHDSMYVYLLGAPGMHEEGEGYLVTDMDDMLDRFVERYNEADMVTGHYIRRHDLPIINGMLYDRDKRLLGSKLTSDTKMDMPKKGDVPATQEWLLELLKPVCPLGIPIQKQHMSQRDWREANVLDHEGIMKTLSRVRSDVHDHEHLRDAMLERGWLAQPRMWHPGGGGWEASEGRHR